LPAALAAGYGLLLRSDPFVRTWAEQNILLSPHPLHYVLAYGLLLPAALFAARRAPAGEPADWALLAGWVLALPLLAYAPTVVQRRLPEGGWVALAILAALGLSQLGMSPARRWRLALVVAAASLISSALLVAGAVLAATTGSSPAYRSADEVAAFEWLDAQADHGAVVLAAYTTGNALPAWADVRVVVGHGPESIGLAALRPRVEAFYQDSGATSEAAGLLAEFDIAYVFVGPAERALGFRDEFWPGGSLPSYQDGDYTIYRLATGSSVRRIPERTDAALSQVSTLGAGR
jgi:hypothetical protein